MKCKECGIKTTNPKFCSRSCSASHGNKNRVYAQAKSIKCKVCGVKTTNPKFCSRSCSATYNNIGKVRNKVVKRKNYTRKYKEKYCKGCNKLFKGKHKQYCRACKSKYYKLYRPSCEFKFNPEDYCDWFDCAKIQKHGKYSPSNKGNNLKGVSRDHMVSVKYGFENNISSDIIKHPANCNLMEHGENISKHTDCSITIDELLLRIKKFNKLYL